MNKFGSPFKGTIWVTQTPHYGSNNKAIDCNPKETGSQAGSPIYAIADGVIQTVSPSYGAYCTQKVNNSPITIFYVHTYHWLSAGTKVQKGQKIAELAPKSVSGENIHLHLGLGKVNSRYPNIMDFFDRNIPIKTRYADIKADWFNSDGTFNWQLHKDLDYKTMKQATMYLIGDRFKFVHEMNIRDINGKDIGDVSKGAVGEIVGVSTYHDGYQWYKMKFLDMTGWIADTDYNIQTTDVVTLLNGGIPVVEPEPEPEPEPIEPSEPVDETETPEEPAEEPEEPQEDSSSSEPVNDTEGEDKPSFWEVLFNSLSKTIKYIVEKLLGSGSNKL